MDLGIQTPRQLKCSRHSPGEERAAHEPATEETTQGRKGSLKRIEVTVPSTHTGLGILPIPTSHSEGLHDPWAVGRVLRKGTIGPRLNKALDSN